MREIFDSFAGFDDFLIYLGVSLGLLGMFAAIYVRVTPHREIELVRQGNLAAAYSFCGALLGFIIPLSSAVRHSVSLVDMAIWGLIALLVQIATFVVVNLLVPRICDHIAEGKEASGFFLGAFSLGVGMLNAACMSY
jgi:putative membrane protein